MFYVPQMILVLLPSNIIKLLNNLLYYNHENWSYIGLKTAIHNWRRTILGGIPDNCIQKQYNGLVLRVLLIQQDKKVNKQSLNSLHGTSEPWRCSQG